MDFVGGFGFGFGVFGVSVVFVVGPGVRLVCPTGIGEEVNFGGGVNHGPGTLMFCCVRCSGDCREFRHLLKESETMEGILCLKSSAAYLSR